MPSNSTATDVGKPIIVENCQFIGSATKEVRTRTQMGVQVNSASVDAKILNCTFDDFKYGVYINSARNVVVDGCDIELTRYGGVVADKVVDITITNTVFANISFVGYDQPAYGTCIAINDKDASTTISNNTYGYHTNSVLTEPVYTAA